MIRNVVFWLIGLPILSFLQPDMLYAQVVAGEIPPGYSVIQDGMYLERNKTETDTIGEVDLDLDGNADLQFTLQYGYPAVDFPHSLKVKPLNADFSLCQQDTGRHRLATYDFGDTLCLDAASWQVLTLYTLQCFGAWACSSDTTPIAERYMAYRHEPTGTIGWLLFSLDLYPDQNNSFISFTIHSFLPSVPVTSTQRIPEHSDVYLYPNPTSDGFVYWKSERAMKHMKVCDALGRIMPFLAPDEATILLPFQPGIYTVFMQMPDGQVVTKRIVRR